MKRLATLIAFVAFAASAQAAPEIYVINNSQTLALFSYSALGVSSKTNKFEKTSGKVVFDQATKTGSVDVTIDATSVNTGHALFDQQIQAADFFDTARHPAITFKSSNMTLDGDQMSLSGDLTIKGVTKPVTLAITHFQCMPHPLLKVDACGAKATVTVKRSDFNMGKYALLVSNDITLNLAIEAVKAQPAMQVASRDPMQ